MWYHAGKSFVQTMKIEELVDGGEQTAQSVRSVLNILLESPYFYKEDDERLFLVLMRHKRAFEAFFENYSDERVRQILKGIMPQLERYRFLRKIKPSADDSVSEAETIFECLPAMWHYQAAQLAQPIAGRAG